MTANEAISSWEKIQQGVKEAETLMGNQVSYSRRR